jgi:SAM-dependent methyltransferase
MPAEAQSLLAAPAGWPFWAPTPGGWVEAALDLAALQPGERFADLGCGDGRVLAAAAARGARVTGYESDPRMAARARERLAGSAAEIVEGDFRAAGLEADVVYCYLSPATLARLKPLFARLAPGTRLVTAQYAVTGWTPAARGRGCYLYRLPPAETASDVRPGWWRPGLLVAALPGRMTLDMLQLGAPAGPVCTFATSALSECLALLPGDVWLDAPAMVPVDFLFQRRPEGTCVLGEVLGPGGAALQVLVVYRAGTPGRWYVERAALPTLARLARDPGEAGRFVERLCARATS